MLKSFKNISVIFLILTVCFSFTGCSESTHLKDLAIVEGLGIDLAESKENDDDGQIEITIQTLNADTSSSVESQQGNMTVNTKKKADSVTDGINKLSKSVSKRIFFGQNKLIVIGKDASENYLEQNLDYFFRSSDSRSDVAVCISATTAEDILESEENDALVPSENILKLIQNNETEGLSVVVTTAQLMNLYTDKTSDIFIPVLNKEDDEAVNTAGIALFNGDTLACITNENQTFGFCLINGDATNVSFEADDETFGKVGVTISNIKSKKSAAVIDGNVLFKLAINADMMVNESQNDLFAAEELDKIENIVESYISKRCREAFTVCRDNYCDCLRVGEYLAANDAEAYDRMSPDWKNYFSRSNISIDINIRIKKVTDNTQRE